MIKESISIFEYDDNVVVQTTIEELKHLYCKGYSDGDWPYCDNEPVTVGGEIIEE